MWHGFFYIIIIIVLSHDDQQDHTARKVLTIVHLGIAVHIANVRQQKGV